MSRIRAGRLTESYLSLSLEAMGVFRIAFGLVHLADLIRRWPMIELLYSNSGVLSNHYLLFQPPGPQYFTLLSAFSSPAQVKVYFALLGLATALFTLGHRTRLFHVICAIGFISLHQRNVLIEYGGDVVSNIFWVLTIFLPLGSRCSLDAAEQGSKRNSAQPRFFSLACFLCLLQFAIIYFLNAVQKSGPSWVDGTALYYTLHQDRAVTELGAWVASAAPLWLLKDITWSTRWIELCIPLLLFLPCLRTAARMLALLLVWNLHLGIALTLNIGIFSALMMSIALLFLDGRPVVFLAACGERAIAPLRRLVRQDRRMPTAEGRSLGALRELLALGMLYLMLSQMARDNPSLSSTYKLPQPRWVESIIGYARIFQGWSLFAPDAPRTDGWLVMDLELASGEHFDPQTGLAPNFSRVHRTALPWQQAWDSYSLRISFDRFTTYRQELARWITERGVGLHPYNPADVVAYQVWWVTDQTPAPGFPETEIGKTLLIEGKRKGL